jgi:hypothetical protein
MQMQGIHFCTKRGVLAIFMKPTQTVVSRVDEVNLTEALGVSSGHLSPNDLGSDLMPNDLKLCGFEAIMSADSVKKFSLDYQQRIISIEIENKRKRILPVNHNKRDRHASPGGGGS